MTKITWHTQQMKLGDLKEWDKNPRQLTKHDAEQIKKSIETFGLADPLIANLDGSLIGGHQRKKVLMANGATDDVLVDVRIPNRQLSKEEAAELNIRLNRNVGEWNWEGLAEDFNNNDLLDWGFGSFELGIIPSIDYSELDEEVERLKGLEDVNILITVPMLYREEIIEWLANDEFTTSVGLGKGVMKRCGLL